MLEDDGGRVTETRSSRLKKVFVKQLWQPKKREWRLILFVLFLFVVIVAGLVVIYHLHQEELIYIYHHHNVTLHKTQLDVRFRNAAGTVVLTGTLWKDSPPRGKPYDCSEEEEGHDEGHGQGPRRLCLLWKTVRRLEIDHFRADGGAVCNRIRWHFLSPDPSDDNSDCFDLGGSGGEGVKWFGAGILKNTSGTLDAAFIARQAFVTGDLHAPGAFGPVVERVFLSSQGVAIVVEANSSLELSVNSPDRQLCLHTPALPVHPVFGYVVCIDESVTKVRRDALSLLVPNPGLQLPPIDIFDRPVWSTWAYLKDRYNESSLMNFTDEIAERFKGGSPLMMIDEGWEEATGNLEFMTSKFKDPRATVKALHDRNFMASLEVRAQVSTRSFAFENETIQRHLATSLGDEDVPALARRWSGPHEPRWDRGLTGVYDLADDDDDDAVAFLAARLARLRDAIGIDAFHVAGTEVSSLPAHSFSSVADRNEHTRRGVEVASSFGHPLLSIVESASGAQNLSAVIRLVGGTSTWDGPGGLRSVVPSALTLGLLGYPVFVSDSAGGSAYEGLPAKELFLRWFQAAVFLPVVHLSIPPWHYDNETQTTVERLLDVRASLVLPEIRSILAKDPSNLIHSPIVRPIWWLDPADKDALGVVTEFLVGDNVLVAPVLDKEQGQRDIYLPRGLWRDPALGVNHSGPRWLRDYAVNLTSVAYFIRQK